MSNLGLKMIVPCRRVTGTPAPFRLFNAGFLASASQAGVVVQTICRICSSTQPVARELHTSVALGLPKYGYMFDKQKTELPELQAQSAASGTLLFTSNVNAQEVA